MHGNGTSPVNSTLQHGFSTDQGAAPRADEPARPFHFCRHEGAAAWTCSAASFEIKRPGGWFLDMHCTCVLLQDETFQYRRRIKSPTLGSAGGEFYCRTQTTMLDPALSMVPGDRHRRSYRLTGMLEHLTRSTPSWEIVRVAISGKEWSPRT